MALVVKECPICGKLVEIRMIAEHCDAWNRGIPAQEAFPELTPTERESLISGLCDYCQKEVFG